MFETKQDSKSPLFILLPLIAITLLVVLLTACGGGAAEVENSGQPAENSSSNDPAPAENQPELTEEALEPAPTEPVAEPEPTEEVVEEAPVAAGVSYAEDVFPILNSRCINCHGGERIRGDLVMLSYEELIAGGESGQVIIPGDAANSLLVQLVTEKEMPKRGPKLTPAQIQTITDWVNQGAQNN